MDLNDTGAVLVDVDDALKRIGGNMDLYKRLLKRFVEGTQVEELKNALQEGNMDEAARMAHTVKGVSANLSLVMLRAISADLELSIKENLDNTAKLDELLLAYDETVIKIKEITG